MDVNVDSCEDFSSGESSRAATRRQWREELIPHLKLTVTLGSLGLPCGRTSPKPSPDHMQVAPMPKAVAIKAPNFGAAPWAVRTAAGESHFSSWEYHNCSGEASQYLTESPRVSPTRVFPVGGKAHSAALTLLGKPC